MASRGSVGYVIGVLKSTRDALIRGIVIDLVETLAGPPESGGTPRDTGWAASRWIATVGTRSGSAEPKPPGFVGPASTAEQDQSVSAMAFYRAEDGPASVTNLVPYVPLLNDGSSSQAPQGFVQAAVAKAVRGRGRAVIS